MEKILKFLSCGIRHNEVWDWYEFMGFCDFHRLSGYAAGYLEDQDIPPQVKRHLNIQKMYQSYRQNILFEAAMKIEQAFSREEIPHAFLKGTALNGTLYKKGERGSNDVDLLIAPREVGKAGKVLESLGYTQGLYRNGKIVPFSRREILSRRMNRGETAPYLKLTGDESVPFIEIDLNFSLNWLPSTDTAAVDTFLANTEQLKNGLTGLKPEYCLAFLCVHLYKEATVLSMVKRFKDIELYKYLDIFLLLPKVEMSAFHTLTQELGLKKECDYALYHTKLLFPESEIDAKIPVDNDIVIDPENGNKRYVWGIDFLERLEDLNRLRYLTEERPLGWQSILYRHIAGGER